MTTDDMLRADAWKKIRQLMGREKMLAAQLAGANPEARAGLHAELVSIACLRNRVFNSLVDCETA